LFGLFSDVPFGPKAKRAANVNDWSDNGLSEQLQAMAHARHTM
jgi:hypothetical protein